METILQLVVIVILTVFEGVFVAAEIALVTIRRTRIEQLAEEGNRSAKRVRGLIAQPGRFLAVTQIGLTFLGFLASAYAAVNLTASLEQVFEGSGVTILSHLSRGARADHRDPAAQPVHDRLRRARAKEPRPGPYGTIRPPPERLHRGPPRCARTPRQRPDGDHDGRVADARCGRPCPGRDDHQELSILVERGGEQGILEAEEEQMIQAVIELGDQRIHEVMVPRIAMVTLPAGSTLEDAIDIVVEEGHSRIPVYEDTIDEIIGILYAKDLLPFLKASAAERPALRSLLRTPVFVPESMSVDDLLHEFQRRKVHIAIVLDEYGGTAGLVTIEDLLEEIVGEIQDEYDEEEPLIVRLSDDEARIDGRADVDDLADLFDTNLGLEDADEYDTVGGLIYHRIGGVPKPGDQVTVDGLTLTVETTDGRRVGKVLAVRDREGGEADDDEADR